METAYLLMDVGGTEIKCGISDGTGRMLVQENFLQMLRPGRRKYCPILRKLLKRS